MGLSYSTALVTLASQNFLSLVEFYGELLGQTPNPYLTERYAEFRLLGLRLGIFQPHRSHQNEFNHAAGSGMSLCLEVSNLDKAIALVTDMGYPPPGIINLASHGREIYAYDPDGNRLILHESC